MRCDVLVAGGGIAGLTAAASLAAAGISVLLAERGEQLGGGCASFTRGAHRFDTGSSSLSGLGPGGRLRRLFDEIGLEQAFVRPRVRETILTPRFTLALPADRAETVAALVRLAPGSREALHRLLGLLEGTAAAPAGLRTCADVLEACGIAGDLAFLLEALLGNLGVRADEAHAATAISFYREFLLDGGYYPDGGMGAFAANLGALVASRGGAVRCAAGVEAYEGDGARITRARLADGVTVEAGVFIHAASPRRALGGLLPATPAAAAAARDAAALRTSPSAFMVFLGLDRPLSDLCPHPGHILSLPDETLEPLWRSLESDVLLFSPAGYLYLIVPSRKSPAAAPPHGETVCLFVLAPYRDGAFWKANRQRMTDTLLARAESVAPGIMRAARVIESSTPLTIERYTGADQGAIYGWAATVAQGGANRLSPVTPWENFVLAGHWTRPGSGISAAAYSGYLAARMARRLAEAAKRGAGR